MTHLLTSNGDGHLDRAFHTVFPTMQHTPFCVALDAQSNRDTGPSPKDANSPKSSPAAEPLAQTRIRQHCSQLRLQTFKQ